MSQPSSTSLGNTHPPTHNKFNRFKRRRDSRDSISSSLSPPLYPVVSMSPESSFVATLQPQDQYKLKTGMLHERSPRENRIDSPTEKLETKSVRSSNDSKSEQTITESSLSSGTNVLADNVFTGTWEEFKTITNALKKGFADGDFQLIHNSVEEYVYACPNGGSITKYLSGSLSFQGPDVLQQQLVDDFMNLATTLFPFKARKGTRRQLPASQKSKSSTSSTIVIPSSTSLCEVKNCLRELRWFDWDGDAAKKGGIYDFFLHVSIPNAPPSTRLKLRWHWNSSGKLQIQPIVPPRHKLYQQIRDAFMESFLKNNPQLGIHQCH